MLVERPDKSMQVFSAPILLQEHATRKQLGHPTQSYISFPLFRLGFIDMSTGEVVYINNKDLRDTAKELDPAIQDKIFAEDFRSVLFG
jgi:hypothetical protein